jgi:hypothetical protein
MNIGTVVLIVVVIVLLYFIIRYVVADSTTLTNLSPGTSSIMIPAANLATTTGINASNFTYSIWYYVSDWNYKFGMPKILFCRMGSTAQQSSSGEHWVPNLTGDNSTDGAAKIRGLLGSPAVFFDSNSNDLEIDIMTAASTSTPTFFSVKNVPLQKWVNFTMSVYGRTLDVYLNGKLVQTNVLPGNAYITNTARSAAVYVTPNGGFSGWTSKFSYFPNAIDPQTAWNIYKAGYGASWMGLLSKYHFKFAFISAGQEASSFTL